MTRAQPWLYLFLGVALTVGFYEGRRVIGNTMKTLEVVSSDWREDEGAEGRKGRAEDRRERRRGSEDKASEGRSGDRKRAQSRDKRGKKGSNAGREKIRERLKRAVQDLSPEEREMLKEEVLERRAERRAEREARRGRAREEGGSSGEGDAPVEVAPDEEYVDQEVNEDEMMEVLEEDLDQELLDTTEPIEP